jgi:hypothetical protein
MKGEKNHWFRIDTAGAGLELQPWGAIQPSASTLDLCSDQCVIKTVQQYLTVQAQLTAPHGAANGTHGSPSRLSEVRVGGEVLFPRGQVVMLPR